MGASCCTRTTVSVKPKQRQYNSEMVLIQKSLSAEKKPSKELMIINPKVAILGLLDYIFDYFTFEDLERMACVCKLFCYVATLDKLYIKYQLTSNYIPSDSFEGSLEGKFKEKEVENDFLNNDKNVQKQFTVNPADKRYTRATSGITQKTFMDSNFATPHFREVAKMQGRDDRASKFSNSSIFTINANMLANNEYYHAISKFAVQANENLAIIEDNLESVDDEDFSEESSVNDIDVNNIERESTKEKMNGKSHENNSVITSTKQFDRSPTYNVQRFQFKDNSKPLTTMKIKDLVKTKRPTLANTMVFTEHMNEGYTDSSHLDKVLKSLDSQELMCSPKDFVVEK